MLKCCRWYFDVRRDSLWRIHPEVVTYELQRTSFAEEMSFSVLIFPATLWWKKSRYTGSKPGCQDPNVNQDLGITVTLLMQYSGVTLLYYCVSIRCFEAHKMCVSVGGIYHCFRSSRIKLYFDLCKNLIGMDLQTHYVSRILVIMYPRN